MTKGDILTLRDELLAMVAPYGQEHLLGFWEQLDAEQRDSLASQIRAIDFALIDALRHNRDAQQDVRALAARAQTPPAFRRNAADRFTSAQARQRGRQAVAEGKLGVILVAGGQGTRLGFDHPKGMYSIGPVSKHSLFQIHIEKIVAAARRDGVRIPLYLMTSPATHDETVAYMAANDRFGLPAEDLVVFCQGTMPAIDARTGRILLDRPDHVFVSPDGHGGMLAALARSGSLADVRRRGIEHLFYFQVDNPLVDIPDLEFVGYHLLAESELSTQVIAKRDPFEKVGNLVAVDGAVRVIEYSDLPDDVAQRRNPDGSLAIWAGSIGVHVMKAAFLERMAAQTGSLPFHRASKKVPCVDAAGQQVKPTSPNAIKFERFIFDLLPSAAGAIGVEVDPRQSFAPLKNASGEKADTPETVRDQIVALHTQWLRQAGVEVAEGVPVEISPLFALDPDELRSKAIAGRRIASPTFLGPAEK